MPLFPKPQHHRQNRLPHPEDTPKITMLSVVVALSRRNTKMLVEKVASITISKECETLASMPVVRMQLGRCNI